MKEYLEYHFNVSLNNLIPYSLLEKYRVIIYERKEDNYLILTDHLLDYFSIKTLNKLLKSKIKVFILHKVELDTYFEEVRIYLSKEQALTSLQNMKKTDTLTDENEFLNDSALDNAPVVKVLDTILLEAILKEASDIHIEPQLEGVNIRVRVDGELSLKNVLSNKIKSDLTQRIKVLSNLDITNKYISQDGKFEYKNNGNSYDIRVSILPGIYGEIVVLRILYKDKKLLHLNDLLLYEEEYLRINKMINSEAGLILVSGPTGSGKSTTLETFLLENTKKVQNIISVEDPVEYTIPLVNQVQVNSETNLSFGNILKSIVRQDPNVIMIGEIRDEETGNLCCKAAITGHLVYSSIHSQTSFSVFSRLGDMGIKKGVLIDSLKGIISQRLVRVLCEDCKTEDEDGKLKLQELGINSDTKIYKPCGCGKCDMTGYKKRRGVYEVIYFDDEVKMRLHTTETTKEFYDLLCEKNIRTLKDYGIKLLLEGVTSYEEVKKLIN